MSKNNGEVRTPPPAAEQTEKPKTPAPQKPSVGRIVLYMPPEGLRGKAPQPYPAIITHVWSETCVNLAVFGDGTYGLPRDVPTNVSLSPAGEEIALGCWAWPPRV
jgi:hypothetical protein